MSDSLLAAKTYRIENTWWQGLYVSSEHLGDGLITGNRFTLGGIQLWRLDYKDGFATFQGVTRTMQTIGHIYVDEAGKGLIYSITDKVAPTKFKVEKVDSLRPDVYIVTPIKEDGSDSYPIGWQLKSGNDGTQIGVSNVMIEGGEWRFIEHVEGSD